MLNIATALIFRRNPQFEVLLIDRNKLPYKDYLAFPGGKMEDGETMKEAVLREIREETGITSDKMKSLNFMAVLNEHYFKGEILQNHFLLNYYVIEVEPEVTLQPTNEGELLWMDPKNVTTTDYGRILPSDVNMLEYFLTTHRKSSDIWARFEGILVNESTNEIEVLKLTKWEHLD